MCPEVLPLCTGGVRLQGLQERSTEKTIALTVRTTKLTAKVLKKMLEMFLDRKNHPKHGKQSIKDLVGQNAGVTNIEVSDGNIKAFERIAKKYNVDFAIQKDKTVNPPKYLVYFKARDATVLEQAFKEFVKENEKRQNRVPLKEKLQQFGKKFGKEQNHEKAREHQREKWERVL